MVLPKKKIELLKRKITQILDEYLGEEYCLWIFGSSVKGSGSRSSDLDLAVYRQKQIPSSAMVEVREAIEGKAGTLREIDLINLTDENINVSLIKNILQEGILWKEARNSQELLENLKKRLAS